MDTAPLPEPIARERWTIVATNWVTGIDFVCRTGYTSAAQAERGAALLNTHGPWQARVEPQQRGDSPGCRWTARARTDEPT